MCETSFDLLQQSGIQCSAYPYSETETPAYICTTTSFRSSTVSLSRRTDYLSHQYQVHATYGRPLISTISTIQYHSNINNNKMSFHSSAEMLCLLCCWRRLCCGLTVPNQERGLKVYYKKEPTSMMGTNTHTETKYTTWPRARFNL